jgi:uncharacterized protein with HEPN domain
MKPRTIQSLLDIHELSRELMGYYAEPVSLEQYESDRTLQRVTERLVEVIGEAVYRVHRSEPDLAEELPEAAKIMGIRNRIAHGYDALSDEAIWLAATVGVPDLDQKVASMLERVGELPDE